MSISRNSADRSRWSSKHTLLGVALAVILTASVIPTSFNMQAAYAETFMTFDGNDYIQVPSSSDLQLPKFTIEVKFRIQDLSTVREYLVSKGAGDGISDQNYVLYVTKTGSIGGGFKAADGNYYYIYSWQIQSLNTWHVAKLNYDGSRLTLEIDDKVARRLTVGSNPDSSGTDPLNIGRHSSGKNGYFIGDIDYVSIIDGRDNQRVYFNDFGTSPPANAAPVAYNDWGSTNKNTAKQTWALSNDVDPDGDLLTITSVTDPPKGTATNNGDGAITYMPDLNFVGTDTYQYSISDGKGGIDSATVTIQIKDTTTNNPPNAVNDSTGTTKNTAVTTNVLANDSDPDGDTLTITWVANPPHGSTVKNSGGTVTYTPDTGFVGTDSYSYTISDGAATDTATVTVSVSDTAPTNNPPNAVNDSTGTTKNTAVTTNVLANDSDPDGDTLTITWVANPPHGSTVKNSGGTVTYTPDTGFVGTDSYSYTISDGAATDTATVTVSVSDTAPPPPSGSDCSDVPLKNMRGVVFNDGTLEKREAAKTGTVLTAYVTESFKYIKSNGFNTIRVPYYWEAYVNNPTVFMEELDLVARTADTYDLCVVFANFHYHTSSYWGTLSSDHGRGFPSFMVKNFPNVNDNYIKTAGPFWDAFLSNSIVVNGRSGWDLQGDFIKSVISKVDHYGSVAGYEILNEPHLFNKAMYDKLGNYHTYMAKKMRAITDKKIYFDRETAWGFTRDPTLEHKIVPDGVSRLVYAVQAYAIPTSGSSGLKQMNNFKDWSQQWGTEVFICEMAPSTLSDAKTFLQVLKSYGFGWTAHAWRPYASPGLGESYYESSTVAANAPLKSLRAAMQEIYWG